MSIDPCRTLEDIEFSRMTRTEQLLELNRRLRALPLLVTEHNDDVVAEITIIRDMLLKKKAKKIASLKEKCSKNDEQISSTPSSSPSSSLNPWRTVAFCPEWHDKTKSIHQILTQQHWDINCTLEHGRSTAVYDHETSSILHVNLEDLKQFKNAQPQHIKYAPQFVFTVGRYAIIDDVWRALWAFQNTI